MKKNYSAPKLLVERFELKNRITQSCGALQNADAQNLGSPSLADKASCGWKIGEGMILWPSAPACTVLKSADEQVGPLCYNNPGGGGSGLFIS